MNRVSDPHRPTRAAHAPIITVIVCTLNGGEQLRTCLAAILRQSVIEDLQLVVVDDGSSDESAEVAREYGAEVVRHSVNRGLAAARNTGLGVARAPIVAYLDDDCEAEPDWAERLLGGMPAGALGVGGLVQPVDDAGYLNGYLRRNNPLTPLELDLATKATITYRFSRYLLRNLRPPLDGPRPVYSLVGANMAFRSDALRTLGGFDERFRFGAEETDLCLRLEDHYGRGRLQLEPSAIVRHHFDSRLRDVLRRRRAYGVGTARLYCKRGDLPPTIFPFPVVLLVLILVAKTPPSRLIAAAVLPQLMFPAGALHAVKNHQVAALLDSYLHVAEEATANAGYLTGLWRYRNFDSRHPKEAREVELFPK